MASRFHTLLEQSRVDVADLKSGLDGDEDDDEGEDMSWEDVMAAHLRRMVEHNAEEWKREFLAKLEERKREFLAKLPLVPFQQKYTYQHREEETECTKLQMALEERQFAVYRTSCESYCYGSFEDTTTLSPVYFTHWKRGRIPLGIATTGSSLQIYSFEVQMKGENLNWPLYVYGMVAARDNVDRNRNLLFCRTRHNCQMLTQDDQFLRLTGLSRAILALDPVALKSN